MSEIEISEKKSEENLNYKWTHKPITLKGKFYRLHRFLVRSKELKYKTGSWKQVVTSDRRNPEPIVVLESPIGILRNEEAVAFIRSMTPKNKEVI